MANITLPTTERERLTLVNNGYITLRMREIDLHQQWLI
jgi:hypothetical protein